MSGRASRVAERGVPLRCVGWALRTPSDQFLCGVGARGIPHAVPSPRGGARVQRTPRVADERGGCSGGTATDKPFFVNPGRRDGGRRG
jgi:hypothetical protein